MPTKSKAPRGWRLCASRCVPLSPPLFSPHALLIAPRPTTAVQAIAEKRASKYARIQNDLKFRKRTIAKLTVQCASKPHCIVGWVLDITQADGDVRRGTVVAIVNTSRGAATRHLIHYEDGTEAEVELARKDGHVGKMEKQQFKLVVVQERLPFKKGMLTKRAIVSERNWKDRWFMLDGRTKSLRYFKDEPELHKSQPLPSQKGVFNLAARCTIKVYFDECEDNPDGMPFCFKITSTETGRKLVISCPNAGIMRDWVSVIQRVIDWEPGQEAKRKFAAETRRLEAEAGIDVLPEGEKAMMTVVQGAIRSLNEALDREDKDITDLVKELCSECCTLKPKVTKLIMELLTERPDHAKPVMKMNTDLDSAIDRAHVVLEGLGVDVTIGSDEESDDGGGGESMFDIGGKMGERAEVASRASSDGGSSFGDHSDSDEIDDWDDDDWDEDEGGRDGDEMDGCGGAAVGGGR